LDEAILASPTVASSEAGADGTLSDEVGMYRVTVQEKPFGINVQKVDVLRVVNLLPGSAAEVAGVRCGLVLVAVNDHPVNPSTWLKVFNEALLPFTLTFRSELHLPDGNPLQAAGESVEAVKAMAESKRITDMLNIEQAFPLRDTVRHKAMADPWKVEKTAVAGGEDERENTDDTDQADEGGHAVGIGGDVAWQIPPKADEGGSHLVAEVAQQIRQMYWGEASREQFLAGWRRRIAFNDPTWGGHDPHEYLVETLFKVVYQVKKPGQWAYKFMAAGPAGCKKCFVFADGSQAQQLTPFTETEQTIFDWNRWWPCIVVYDPDSDTWAFYCPALAWMRARPWGVHWTRVFSDESTRVPKPAEEPQVRRNRWTRHRQSTASSSSSPPPSTGSSNSGASTWTWESC